MKICVCPPTSTTPRCVACRKRCRSSSPPSARKRSGRQAHFRHHAGSDFAAAGAPEKGGWRSLSTDDPKRLPHSIEATNQPIRITKPPHAGITAQQQNRHRPVNPVSTHKVKAMTTSAGLQARDRPTAQTGREQDDYRRRCAPNCAPSSTPACPNCISKASEKQKNQLIESLAFLSEWNAVINLTAIREPRGDAGSTF